MAKTKQQKFTDSLRQAQTNIFSDGLNMDLHPLSAPNTIMTDCVNGTMVTYNDNEFVLQNERGNSKIWDAQLSPGFIPVAMKEYNGILYIISHNPTENKTEIGTFPSPRQNKDLKNVLFNSEIISNQISYFSEYKSDITFYDYSLVVSNYDKYCLSIGGLSPNPLLVLDHYVLDKYGNSTKIKLVQTENSYRFTHVGEGILGYIYRPYFLSSVTSAIIPTKGAESSKLIITSISDDESLWENISEENFETGKTTIKKKIDDLKVIHHVKVSLLSNDNGVLEIDLENSNLNGNSKLEVSPINWEYTYNLSNTSTIDLQFPIEFTINTDKIQTYKYDFRNECVVLMDGDYPTNITYDKIKFDIITSIEKDGYIIYMDHLDHSTISDVSDIFTRESWFSKFQYFLSEDQTSANLDEVLIDFNVQLDLESYDIKYQLYNDSHKRDATYKLYEIDETGNLKGVSIAKTQRKTYNIVSNVFEMKPGDLWMKSDNVLYYNKPNVGLTPVQDVTDTLQCMEFKSSNNASYVQYIKQDDETYNMILLDSDYKILSTTNLFSTFTGEQCGNDMEEYFTPGYFDFIAKNVKVKKNSFYLFELTFDIFNISENKLKTERASFIVITSDSMLNKAFVSGENRMDEIMLEDWFGKPYNADKIKIDNIKYNTPKFKDYKNNIIDLEKIDNKSTNEVNTYTHKFFLKYNPLFDEVNNNYLPSIYQTLDVNFNFENLSPFNCFATLEDHDLFSIEAYKSNSLEKTYKKTWSLIGKPFEMTQTVKRNYLWDSFKEIDKIDTIKINQFWTTGVANHISDVIGYEFDNPRESYATWINYLATPDGVYTNLRHQDWLNSTSDINDGISFNRSFKYLVPDTSSLYGASLRLMKRLWTKNGLNYGEIKYRTDGNYPQYDGEKKKIWMHGKHRGVYVLVGMDLQKDFETSNNFFGELLKHSYYLTSVNKKVYQYIFELESVYDEHNVYIGDQIVINIKNPEINKDLTGKMYPKQCLFIDNDYSSFNIQSYNNINYHVLNNVNNINFNADIIPSFSELDENYSFFLRLLGTLLNTYPISENTLTEYFDNSLRFDFYAEHLQENECRLFTDNLNSINEGKFHNSFNTISSPNLQYDRDLEILYNPSVSENNINSFGSEQYKLNWNYSVKFLDFWDVNDDELKNLNDYHSLLFYRYSSYANE